MTEFKDVMHLYLGCKMFNFKTSRYTELVHIRIGADLSDMKPILRPLLDMTEEEQDCLKSIRDKAHDDFVGRKASIFYFTDAASTKYLLLKGFDLFGLIETQQAIDKTKLVLAVEAGVKK